MPAPTPATRIASHLIVGYIGGHVVNYICKIFGIGGAAAYWVGFALTAVVHELYDAPVARGMVALGLQL